MSVTKIDEKLLKSKGFGEAAIAACAIAESLFKDYTKEYVPAEIKLENIGRKLRKNFHGIAMLAVKLATGTDGKPRLQLAQAYFVELCNRAEAKLLKDHPAANGEPFKKITDLIGVWGNYKSQVKAFFEGLGKMPESKDASDNPADYTPENFVNELMSRKAGRAANPTDGTHAGLTDSVQAACTVMMESAAKCEANWQDDTLLPLLADINLLIEKHLTARKTQKPAQASGEVDAPARKAA